MKVLYRFLNLVVAAQVALFGATVLSHAQDNAATRPASTAPAPGIEDYLDRLPAADADEAARIEGELVILWSKSGSPAIDLLYRRGSDALEAGDAVTAAEHLTAAIDQDPDFLAARDLRASAYYLSGQIGPALADMSFVLAHQPRQFATLAGLGGILEETNQPARALDAYRAAAAIHPHMAEVNDAIQRLSKELEGQDL